MSQNQIRAKKSTSPQPLYQQVKQYIEERIINEDWLPDSKIPSENELVEKLGVSRMTINRALRELTTEGYLVRLQGVGTFIAERKPQSALLEIKSIAEEIRNMGGIHSSTVHILQEEKAAPELADTFEIPPGSSVFHSILVHRDKGIPIQLADRFVNPAIAPDFLSQDFTKITPNEYLINIAPISEVEHIIEAILPDKKIKKLLEIEITEPCLVLIRKTWVGNLVATRSRFIYPGSRYRIGGRFKPSSIAHRIIT